MVMWNNKLLISCIFAIHLVLSGHCLAMTVNPSECRRLMDLYIVMDGSDSIAYDDFTTLKQTVAGLVNEIELGPAKARIGMLVYSSNVPKRSKHEFYVSPQEVIGAAMTLQHPRDGTHTAKGLLHMRKMFSRYGREDVPWVCVVITDGISKNPKATHFQAREAEKMGISMFAVGVGHKINAKELQAIASTPKQVLQMDNFGQLASRLSYMMTKICPCPLPPVLPLAKCMDGPRAIGTVRQYKCKNGYLQRGNPSITCLDDFTWTPLSNSFECIPCSQEVPVVLHGSCGGGAYTLGTVRSYTCDPGYLPVGNPDIRCRDDATWSVPDFKCIPCGDTPMVNHGVCGGGDYTLGARRVFTCEPGYMAVGNPNIMCQNDATWSIPDFRCVPCGATPTVKHGICGDGQYTLGSNRVFTCQPGYMAVGNPNIMCQNDATWSIPDFRCVPCGATPTVQHGICGAGDYTLGSGRVFTCEPGYMAVGNPNIMCQNDATWSIPDFKCIPCGDTPIVQHGICGGGEYTLGSRRVFTCEPGYMAVGNPNIMCQNDASWSIPDFKCVPCGLTPTVQHGVCGAGAFTLGASRVFTCEAGYLAVGNPNIMCQNDATWSVPDFKCIPCGDTPLVDHGICGGGDYTLGASRVFTCDPGYMAVGNPNIMCQNDATWSIPDFKCVPCGVTPTVKHGLCGAGDFTLGSSRVFTCEPGYLAVGNPNIMCQNDATWSIPDFKCIPCGDTPVVQHGVCGGGDYTLGANRIFTCEPGYMAVGNPNIMCQNDATWSIPDFKCVPCGATPTVQHGTCGTGAYTLGSNRVFTCEPGYLAVGNPNIMCQNDATWSIPDFKCIPCGDTPIVQHGVCGSGEYILGASRQFTCEPGYMAVGNPNIMCQNDATWSIPDFKCVPCGVTPVIQHGICGAGAFTLGSSRVFTCEPGYFAVGNPNIMCQNDATWSIPDFKCIPCGDTPVVQHGVCGGGDYTLGANRVFTCEPGYMAVGNPNIMCQNDATWSIPDFKCVPCGATPTVKHGICGDGQYTLGSSRLFTCQPGYMAVGNPNIMCQNDATWSIPDFKCVPCGATPTVQHGICGAGDYTLGSGRVFTCEPGYMAVGNPNIMCQNDATWSIPDFKCVPCGATPIVQHGVCGSGDFTLGSSRVFTCEPGYLAVGNPNIMCQNDATWSIPDFKCVPCGDTPVVQHGVCGGGDYTLGANRIFTCEPGYMAVGNPNIMCQNDATWSLPDFKCVPCGATPLIDHGSCGPGGFTLGSLRKYECAPGYAAIGNPEITCRDDATWSTLDFKCAPCGDTPVIPNGVCGGGDHLVGVKRSFTCNKGYRPVGNPNIECLGTGQWSVPDFQCLDCGAPPLIANAYTQLGPSMIGSTREYYCEGGYDMYGPGQITCMENGRWSKPSFSCNVKTTTTTTTPPPVSGDPSVCDGCRYMNGVGFNSHPFDCNQYVQCFVGRRGLEPVYRKCPFGLFWDQNVLTCRPSQDVRCPHDKCRDRRVKGYRNSDPDSCCSYWKCDKGRSYGDCCGPSSTYNPVVGRCVQDVKCKAKCPYEDELPEIAGHSFSGSERERNDCQAYNVPYFCDRQPSRRSDTTYEQHVGNNIWVTMPCAPGTAFNPVDCSCSLVLMNVPGKRRQQVCRPEVYLPFRNSFDDRSGRHVYIRPENVSIHNGAAYFNGNSRILINRFSNTEFRGDLVVKFRYNEVLQGPTASQLQALVTNGDCGSDPSVVIAKMPGYVLLGAKTDKPRSFALPSLDKVWKEVIYIHDEKKLEGRVCGASMSKWSWGPIQSTQCAMQIGYGNGLQNFIGYIDDFYVYQCRPRAHILNIDY